MCNESFEEIKEGKKNKMFFAMAEMNCAWRPPPPPPHQMEPDLCSFISRKKAAMPLPIVTADDLLGVD